MPPRSETYSSRQGVAVTPSDSTDLAPGCRGLYVGTGGDVSVYGLENNTAVVYKNVGNGAVLPIQCKRVLATSTTASDIVALY